jgi:hypothetical protein
VRQGTSTHCPHGSRLPTVVIISLSSLPNIICNYATRSFKVRRVTITLEVYCFRPCASRRLKGSLTSCALRTCYVVEENCVATVSRAGHCGTGSAYPHICLLQPSFAPICKYLLQHTHIYIYKPVRSLTRRAFVK